MEPVLRPRTRPLPICVLLSTLLAVAFGLLVEPGDAMAATKTWTGGDPMGIPIWSAPLNWSPAGAPVGGEDLVFPAGAALLSNANSLAAGTSFNSITFTGAGYTINGNPINLAGAGDLVQAVAGANVLNLGITLIVPCTADVSAGGLLLLGGSIVSGATSLTKDGAGTVRFTGSTSNTYTGLTTINAGTLELGKTGGASAVAGNIRVGNDAGGADADVVRLLASNQLANTSVVNVRGSGLFDLDGFSETIGGLQFDNAAGSIPRVTTGAGTLTLNGDVSSGVSAFTSLIQGKLDLGGTTRTFSIANGGADPDLTIDAAISVGAGGLTKTGSGSLRLNGSNSYFGPTTVSSGTLVVTGTQSLSAVTVASGATLRGTGTVGALAGNGTIAPGLSAGILTAGGAVTLSATGMLAIEIGGTSAGSGFDQLAGFSSVNLGGATLSATLINGFVPSTSTAFTIVTTFGALGGTFNGLPDGAALTISGRPFTITYTANSVILTSQPATKTWTGGHPVNDNWTEALNWAGGAPIAGDHLVFPAGAARPVNFNNFAPATTFRSVTFTGAGYTISGNFINLGTAAGTNLAQTVAGANTLNLGIALAAACTADVSSGSVLFLGGSISGGFGSIFTKDGAGTIRFTGLTSNTYTGRTIISAGTLELAKTGGATAIAAGNIMVVGNDAGGADADVVRLLANNQIANNYTVHVGGSGLFDLNGFSDTIGSLEFLAATGSSPRVTTGSGTLTVNADVSSASSVFTSLIQGNLGLGLGTRVFSIANGGADPDLTIDATISGGVGDGLTKTGAGSLRLNGANTYSGTTTINTGILEVTGHQPSSAVTVSPGATLGGTGTIGALTGNGTVAPGLSAGILTVSGAVTLNAMGFLEIEIGGLAVGSDYDRLAGLSTVNLGGATLTATLISIPAPGAQFSIVTSGGALSGTFAGLPNGAGLTVGGRPYVINYTANSVVLTESSPPPTATRTPTATPTATRTPTPTATTSPTVTATLNPIFSPTSTSSATITPTVTSVSTPTATPSLTRTPTATVPPGVTPPTITPNPTDIALDAITLYVQGPTGFAAAGALRAQAVPGVTLPRPVGGLRSVDVAVGDATGDGIADLLAVGQDDAAAPRLVIYPGTGAGAFGVPAVHPLASGPVALAALDVDLDGILDIAVAQAGAGGNRVDFYRGPVFGAAAQFIPLGAAPMAVAVGQLTPDSDPDFAVALAGSSTIQVTRQPPVTGFDTEFCAFAAPPRALAFGVAQLPTSGVVDSDLDLIAGLTGAVALRENGYLAQPETGVCAAGSPSLSLAVANLDPVALLLVDLNGDGRTDILALDQASGAVLAFLATATAGVYSGPVTTVVGANPTSFAWLPATGGAGAQLVVGLAPAVGAAGLAPGQGSVRVLTHAGAGVFAPQVTIPLTCPTAPSLRVRGGDLNGDGRPDFAVSGCTPLAALATATPTATATPSLTATLPTVPTATRTPTPPGPTVTPTVPIAASVTPTPFPTTSPTASATIGPLVGHGFTLQAGADPLLSWQPGAQTSGLLIRWSPDSAFAFLLPGGNLLPPLATSYTDTDPLPDPLYCWILFAATGELSALNVLGLSDFLCQYPATAGGLNPPTSFRIRLNESPTATLSWVPPSGVTSYILQVVRFDGTGDQFVPIGGGEASFPHPIGTAAACYRLRAFTGTTELGVTDIICGVPGIAALADGPAPLGDPVQWLQQRLGPLVAPGRPPLHSAWRRRRLRQGTSPRPTG